MYYKFPKFITILVGEMFFVILGFFLFLFLPFELLADSSIKAFRFSTDTLDPDSTFSFLPLLLFVMSLLFSSYLNRFSLRKFISDSGNLSLSTVVLSGKLIS